MNKKYDIRTFTIDQMRELIYNGNDNFNNQIRVSNDGFIFLSDDKTGLDSIEKIKYRMETFCAGNEYIGPKASTDNKYVSSLFTMFTTAWNDNINEDYLDESYMPIAYDNQF